MFLDMLSRADIIVFTIITLFTIKMVYISHRLSRNSTNNLEYLLMGRQLTLPLFIATLTSSWYGEIFGVTQIAFKEGLYSFIINGFFWYMAYILFALFLVKKITQYNAMTFPDLISKLIGNKSGYMAAVIIFFKVLPVSLAISLGMLLHNIFGVSLNVGMILGLVFVCMYCSLGGFRAVVISDMVQFVVMFVAVISVVITSYMLFGGADYLKASLPESHFTYNGTKKTTDIMLWLFIAFTATLVSPLFYQRCFAANSIKTARRGIFGSIIFWFVFDMCTTLGGMYARAAMPEAESLGAYFAYSLNILPTGLRGLFIAGVACTIISTLDSMLFISATVLSYDLLPKHSKQSNIGWRMISVFITGILVYIIAHKIDKNFEHIWLTFNAYTGSLLVVPMLMIYIFKMKIGEKVFISGCFATWSVLLLHQLFNLDHLVSHYAVGIYFNFSYYLAVYLTNFFRQRFDKKPIVASS